MMKLRLDRRSDEVAVVRLAGQLDLFAAADVKQRLVAAVDGGHRRLVLDLAEVSFVDSSGLGTLIGALKAARQAGGDLRIARPAEQARVVLELTTLDRVLHPYATVEEALAGL
jgi:anti-anti-sigma factor